MQIKGFKTYLVGGAVRDQLLGMESKDKDFVVVGATQEAMLDLGFQQVGKDFPVFLHPETGFEYALARKERKTGNGYTGFSFDTHNVSIEDDLFRRDLTINAMAIDLSTQELIDPFNGRHDLQNKTLRHVSQYFSEDPVRILRTARFSARYDFQIHQDTLHFMNEMVKNGETDYLVPDRILKEFDKAFSEPYVEKFFQTLSEIGLLSRFGKFDINKILITSSIPTHLRKKQFIYNTSFYHFSDKALREFKIESSIIDNIKIFQRWLYASEYRNLDNVYKLAFIKETKSIHDTKNAEDFLFLSSLMHKFDFKENLEQFKQDILSLKQLDYELISKNNPDNVKNAILNAQKEALTLESKKSKIFFKP